VSSSLDVGIITVKDSFAFVFYEHYDQDKKKINLGFCSYFT